ncbi:hypothetical protein [Flavobacterium sp. NRK F7]|uniref:hypothetical protein n=1 Tax=Flavobacterium sp. NRK F7 TaxID=2954930 RepID=UPI0020904420|nr:hypothetical protein [Flavobacterium sp. NRK F7]MCO6164074.1 hypothetical protein [Flavobacterium sp. NRK F7]
MTQEEYCDTTKYFESGGKKLNSKYLLHYHFKPNWSEIPHMLDIFIDQNYGFEVKLFWYKPFVKNRLFSFYQSNLLPENILQIIKAFNSFPNVSLKQLYTSKSEQYSPEGISEDTYTINHPINPFSINMSSHWTDEKLFQSKEEILFLQLHHAIKIWKETLFQGVLQMHN